MPRRPRAVFRSWDEDGDGLISKAEFRKVMRTLGVDATKDEIDGIFSRFDPNGDGTIEYREFSQILLNRKLSTVRGGDGDGDSRPPSAHNGRPKPTSGTAHGDSVNAAAATGAADVAGRESSAAGREPASNSSVLCKSVSLSEVARSDLPGRARPSMAEQPAEIMKSGAPVGLHGSSSLPVLPTHSGGATAMRTSQQALHGRSHRQIAIAWKRPKQRVLRPPPPVGPTRPSLPSLSSARVATPKERDHSKVMEGGSARGSAMPAHRRYKPPALVARPVLRLAEEVAGPRGLSPFGKRMPTSQKALAESEHHWYAGWLGKAGGFAAVHVGR